MRKWCVDCEYLRTLSDTHPGIILRRLKRWSRYFKTGAVDNDVILLQLADGFLKYADEIRNYEKNPSPQFNCLFFQLSILVSLTP